jgi:hypothetical protein
VNSTLDAAATAITGAETRSAAITLLILHKEDGALSGKKLVQLYRTWTASWSSPEVEETLRVVLGGLLLSGLIEIGGVGNATLSKLKGDNLQQVIGQVLSLGMQPVKQIRLTKAGVVCVRLMRRTINDKIREIRRSLAGPDKELFDRMIEALPYPTEPPSDQLPLS